MGDDMQPSLSVQVSSRTSSASGQVEADTNSATLPSRSLTSVLPRSFAAFKASKMRRQRSRIRATSRSRSATPSSASIP